MGDIMKLTKDYEIKCNKKEYTLSGEVIEEILDILELYQFDDSAYDGEGADNDNVVDVISTIKKLIEAQETGDNL